MGGGKQQEEYMKKQLHGFFIEVHTLYLGNYINMIMMAKKDEMRLIEYVSCTIRTRSKCIIISYPIKRKCSNIIDRMFSIMKKGN